MNIMAEIESTFCDLCEAEDCEGPMRYAHKPYLFHFYHSQQYNDALAEFLEKKVNEDAGNVNEDTIIDDESDPDEEEDDEDMVVVESDEENKEEGDEEEEHLFDIEEDIQGESQDENNENVTDEEDEEGEDGDDDEEEEEKDELDYTENVTDDEIAENQNNNYVIPTSLLTPVVSDVNKIMCKTIDVTMAAGVGIMAGIVSMTEVSLPTHKAPASFFSMDSLSKTCVGTVLAGIGMVAGVREILNAIYEKAPELPVCEYCNDDESLQPGCKAFCEICGDCDKGSYWRNGVENIHCLRICRNCYTNCVLCEQEVATVKTHHKAFTTKTHGKLSTRLVGTFRDARIFGSSLIIAGILTCMVPGISWAWGVGLVAGSVIANSGIRIIAKPVVKIHCESCDLVEEADKFGTSTGCQTWCQCCGVRENEGGKKYCLALCEACSDE